MRSPKHIARTALVTIGSLTAAVPAGVVAEPLQTSAAHTILIDGETRTVLFERGADDLMKPASTAKIMTVELVFSLIKSGKLKLDQLLPISETAWRQGGAPSHGATMFAKPHSEISVDDLLHGLIIDSANDAAIALAEGVAGSQGAFATKMTDRARALGLGHLTFTNAWGDDNPDQKVTPREMALLADHLIQTYPDLYKIYAIRDFLWNKIKQPNRDPLLSMDIGADGLTTGNIDDSGFSLVGSAIQNGQRLIVALYGAKSASERSAETRRILQWGFRTFESRKVFTAGETVGSAQVYGGSERSIALVTDHDIKVLVPRDGSEKLSAKIAYIGPLLAPVEAGQPLAVLKLFRGATEVFTTPLRTKTAVARGSLPKRAFDAGLEYVGSLFRKYVLHS